MFSKYVSNTSAATGNSYIISSTNGKKTYRVYIKPQLYGKFNWRFYFSNSVDSTFAYGDVSYRNIPCGKWTVHSAKIAHIKEISVDALPQNYVQITFNGQITKEVMPEEKFWSDEISFEINEGYIVWEWELEGENIPCHPDGLFTKCATDENGKWYKEPSTPTPAMFGCDKKVKKRIVFLGDSITAGCGTPCDKYEMWVGRISDMLCPEYSVWNLGLGYARASDLATNASWMVKAKNADIAIITYGVNDLKSGAYLRGRGDLASELIENLEFIIKELKSNGLEIILSTIPPFWYSDNELREWRCANMAIHHLASMYNCRVYDIESSLDLQGELCNSHPYGEHPDSEGGRIASEKFKETFFKDGKWML